MLLDKESIIFTSFATVIPFYRLIFFKYTLCERFNKGQCFLRQAQS